MVDVAKATKKIAELTMLAFFPSEPTARTALVRIICEEMATTNEQIDWLVRRCLQLWSKWEGPRELRAVFCSKFHPADGHAECYSLLPQFADEGIPSESGLLPGEVRQLTAPEMRQISGEPAPVEFPRDATDLLHEAMERKKAVSKAPRAPDADIAAILAEQNRNRKESGGGAPPGAVAA